MERPQTLTAPTTNPTTTATTTAYAKSPSAPPSEMPPAVAAMAVRMSTSAVASLTRPSPSRMVTSLDGRPRRLPMLVAATASGGLMTAPRATAEAKLRSGSSQ